MSQNEKEDTHKEINLDLNFVPSWARKPPEENPYAHYEERESRRGTGRGYHGRSSDRARSGRGPRRADGRGHERRKDRDPSHHRSDRHPCDTSQEHRHAPGPRHEHDRRPRRLPLHISFIPEKQRIGAMVKQIRSTRRAYPLMELAHIFLSDPKGYLVKIELKSSRDDDIANLYQCRICRAVFLDHTLAMNHAKKEHLDQWFEIEERETEAPQGNFVCVGRCGISGELIGPPNYHGFNNRIQELHQTRFAHMPFADYRAKIEMVHDPDIIAQWKESARKQTIYRELKPEGEARDMTWTEAELCFLKKYADGAITSTHRAIVPAEIMRESSDRRLLQQVRDAWTRESRFPFSLSIALRPAFRHMRLHMFKVGDDITFVTALKPSPVDPSHTVENIREVLIYLMDHPGCTRQELAKALYPDAPPDSPEVHAALQPLRWLIDKGHVIEFFNGTLSVPG